MAYIGNTLRTAQPNYQIIDDISGSFDGVTTTFALQVAGVTPAPFPVSAQHCIISVGGVVQEPDPTGTNGFLLSGSNIVFSSAPSFGESFFGTVLAGADYINVGASFPDGSVANPSITFDQDLDTGLYRSASGTTSISSNGTNVADFGPSLVTFDTGGSESVRIDSSGQVGIGTTTVGAKLHIAGATGGGIAGIWDTGAGGARIEYKDNGTRRGYLNWDADSLYLAVDSGNTIKFSTDAGANEWMRINTNGYISAGGYLVTSAYHRFNGINASQGDTVFVVSGFQPSGGSVNDTAVFSAVSSTAAPNAAASAIRVFRHSSTNRSINAAGTINASGADYAEYMVKSGDFIIAKGDIAGVNTEGKLTNVFADAISFVVKSTDPSYVGGDTWHLAVGEEPGGYNDERTEQEVEAAKIVYQEALETARQNVDRIAFAGQVPVNVIGATPGQYIVPVEDNGGISGIAKNETDLTLAEYMQAVGKVIAIENDGRARIIVKVA